MKKSELVVSILVLTVLVSATSCTKKSSALVRVGTHSITEGDLDALARVNPRLKPRLATPDGKQKVLENYVEQELLFQESTRRGLTRSSAVKDKLALYQKIIVAQALLDDELEKKIKEYYDNHRDEFERMKVSHILIRVASENAKKEEKTNAKKDAKKKEEKKPSGHSEAEALKLVEQARERVTKGEDFGKVAKEVSEDEKTKNNQGDMGFLTIRDKKLERWGWLPVAEKAFALKTGETSDVIKTKDGFHIIRVTEDKKLQPFEEAEAGIKFRLQADIRNQIISDLKKKYKVEYAKADTSAKKSTAAASAAPSTPETAPVPLAPEQPGTPSAESAAPSVNP